MGLFLVCVGAACVGYAAASDDSRGWRITAAMIGVLCIVWGA